MKRPRRDHQEEPEVSYQSAIYEERKRDSSSSIEPFKDEEEEKKKSNELVARTTSTFVLPSRCSAIDVDPSVAMGIGTSADGSSSLSLLAAVRKLVIGWVVAFPPPGGAWTPMMMMMVIRCVKFWSSSIIIVRNTPFFKLTQSTFITFFLVEKLRSNKKGEFFFVCVFFVWYIKACVFFLCFFGLIITKDLFVRRVSLSFSLEEESSSP